MNLTEGQKINMILPPIGEGTVTVVFPIGKVCIFETNTKQELYIPAEGWIQDEEFTSQWLCGEYKISCGKVREDPVDNFDAVCEVLAPGSTEKPSLTYGPLVSAVPNSKETLADILNSINPLENL